MGLLEFKKALVDSKILTNDEYLALKVENAINNGYLGYLQKLPRRIISCDLYYYLVSHVSLENISVLLYYCQGNYGFDVDDIKRFLRFLLESILQERGQRNSTKRKNNFI